MASHVDLLRAQARALPETPGVYFWRDARGRTLYIGKAVNLRARVTSYFSTAKHNRRTFDLVNRSRAIDHEVTSSELQALFRESALIKKEQPPFNVLLRTSRPAYYLKFDGNNANPYMETSRGMDDDDSQYFGPFRTAAIMRETMRYVHDVLPLRKCAAMNPRCTPCLYYQMHKCAAPFLDEEHRRQHQEAIQRLHELLDGRFDRVEEWLVAKRDKMSEHLMFERAAEVQVRIDALHQLLRRQSILEAAVQSRCVLIRDDGRNGQEGRLLLVAHGQVLSARSLAGMSSSAILSWIRAHTVLMKLPRLEQSELDAASVLERWISERRNTIRWTAIRHDATDDELQEQIDYVTTSAQLASAAVPVAE